MVLIIEEFMVGEYSALPVRLLYLWCLMISLVQSPNLMHTSPLSLTDELMTIMPLLEHSW